MSFSYNCKSDKIPGPLKPATALNGICEKVCIQCDKVLDMCMRQEILPETFLPPEGTTYSSYKFLSAKTVSTDTTISNLDIMPVADSSCSAHITCDVEIPIQLVLLSDSGARTISMNTMVVHKDLVMNVATPSIMPYSIVASACVVSTKGAVVGNDIVITACTTIILKVIMPVQLLVPSYGYTFIPPCQEYSIQTCDGIFDLPLYPQESCACEPRCQNTKPNCNS